MAAVTYSKPSISGYNASPPADDGSEVAANEIKWATHKDKLGDPLKTYADAVNDAVEAMAASFGTVTDQDIGKTATTINQGGLVQRLVDSYATQSGITTAFPVDGTVPQSTEGDEILSVAITPNASANRIKVQAIVHGAPSSTIAWGAALFNGAASAVAAAINNYAITNAVGTVVIDYEAAAGGTSEITFTVRAGPASGTLFTNSNSTTNFMGGVMKAWLFVEEYAD